MFSSFRYDFSRLRDAAMLRFFATPRLTLCHTPLFFGSAAIRVFPSFRQLVYAFTRGRDFRLYMRLFFLRAPHDAYFFTFAAATLMRMPHAAISPFRRCCAMLAADYALSAVFDAEFLITCRATPLRHAAILRFRLIAFS